MDSQRADGAGGQQIVPAMRDLTPQVISIMTTEHYNLQSGRAMTVADANGRASLFLGTVSTSLVALAFVGGLSRSGAGLGQAFYIFGLVLFPSLAFLGLVTFERVLQSGIEDLIYARGINRIRHLYQEHAPEMRPYFILSAHDDEAAVMGNLAMRLGVWQIFLSTAGMIAVINSVVVGAFVSLLLTALPAALPLGVSIGAGVAVFLVSVFLHQRYQWLQGRHNLGALRARFPSGAED
ncbi:MAG TPA: hypothetical protein VGP82_03880 [Ktedonobacterales bacterium]|jgi:hypothetical protein|nr:hypothetical protein [Ktedonobacterales bacterium]